MLSSLKSSLKQSKQANQSLTVQFSPGFKQTSVSPSSRVHFPKSPLLAAAFKTYSPKSYNRAAIPVSPSSAADSSWSAKPLKSPGIFSYSNKDDERDVNDESETDSEREDTPLAWKKDFAFIASPKAVPSNIRKRTVADNSTDSSASDSEDDTIPPRPQQTKTVKFANVNSPLPRARTSADLAHALKFLPSPLSPYPNLPYPGSPRNSELSKRSSVSIDSVLSTIEQVKNTSPTTPVPAAPTAQVTNYLQVPSRSKPKRKVPPALIVPKPNAPLRFVPPPGLSRCSLSPVPESPLGSGISEAYYTASDHESIAEQSDASDASNVTLNTAFWRSLSIHEGVEMGESSGDESLPFSPRPSMEVPNVEMGLRVPRMEDPPYSPASQVLAQVLSPQPRDRTSSFSSIDSALMFMGSGGAIRFPINTNV